LKEKNEFLTSQSEDNIKLLESFQLKVGESFESFCVKEEDEAQVDPHPDSKMKEILTSYENQLFDVTSQVKKL
jgi:glycerate-2-kinase